MVSPNKRKISKVPKDDKERDLWDKVKKKIEL